MLYHLSYAGFLSILSKHKYSNVIFVLSFFILIKPNLESVPLSELWSISPLSRPSLSRDTHPSPAVPARGAPPPAVAAVRPWETSSRPGFRQFQVRFLTLLFFFFNLRAGDLAAVPIGFCSSAGSGGRDSQGRSHLLPSLGTCPSSTPASCKHPSIESVLIFQKLTKN